MCGIVGGFGNEAWPVSQSLKVLKHRGPDSEGFFIADNIFLGHTRLSIQDLSENGSQPMYSNDKRYVIIFNGEIYNHWEIRQNDLQEFEFKSSSDTETILYAYIKYGVSFLSKLNGIFSMAIFDTIEKEIFLARDPLGVKPFYFYRDKEIFLFSSELKSFLDFKIDLNISIPALANYLYFLWSPGEMTPLSNAKKLLPGHYLKFRIDNYVEATPHKYYQINFNGTYSKSSEIELIDQLEKKLLQSVKRQMLSDVPVGFFLSGGLDSSLIVAMARKLFPDKNLPCFTINTKSLSETEGFADDLFYAKQVAKHLNVELNIVNADFDIIKDFDKMIWSLDEPQADSAPLNVLNICKYAREKGIKVLLGGTGADDIFSGYRRHQALSLEKIINKVPILFRNHIANIINHLPSKLPWQRRLRKLTVDLNKDVLQRMSGYFSWLPYNVVFSLFTPKMKEQLCNYNPSLQLEELNKDIPDEKSLLNQMLYWEINSFLVDHNLNYTDKLAMATSVEVRVPYLDVDVVEFSTKIPPGLKLKNKETKYILRKVAEKYLPQSIIYRKKTGFGIPIRKWILEDMEPMIKERLSREKILEKGIFDPDMVWNLIQDSKNGKIDASYSIWALLAIDSWITQFIKGGGLT